MQFLRKAMERPLSELMGGLLQEDAFEKLASPWRTVQKDLHPRQKPWSRKGPCLQIAVSKGELHTHLCIPAETSSFHCCQCSHTAQILPLHQGSRLHLNQFGLWVNKSLCLDWLLFDHWKAEKLRRGGVHPKTERDQHFIETRFKYKLHWLK